MQIQDVMVEYFRKREGPMAKDGISALQKSLAAIYYLPFQCGVNLYFVSQVCSCGFFALPLGILVWQLGHGSSHFLLLPILPCPSGLKHALEGKICISAAEVVA